MNGGKSLAQVCGARWPRLLLPTWAAARVSMMLPEFRASAFARKVVELGIASINKHIDRVGEVRP